MFGSRIKQKGQYIDMNQSDIWSFWSSQVVQMFGWRPALHLCCCVFMWGFICTHLKQRVSYCNLSHLSWERRDKESFMRSGRTDAAALLTQRWVLYFRDTSWPWSYHTPVYQKEILHLFNYYLKKKKRLNLTLHLCVFIYIFYKGSDNEVILIKINIYY